MVGWHFYRVTPKKRRKKKKKSGLRDCSQCKLVDFFHMLIVLSRWKMFFQNIHWRFYGHQSLAMSVECRIKIIQKSFSFKKYWAFRFVFLGGSFFGFFRFSLVVFLNSLCHSLVLPCCLPLLLRLQTLRVALSWTKLCLSLFRRQDFRIYILHHSRCWVVKHQIRSTWCGELRSRLTSAPQPLHLPLLTASLLRTSLELKHSRQASESCFCSP